MKNVAIILQDLRSGGSERFASRLSLLLSEKFNVYVLVFDASEKRFDCAGEFVDLGLPAGKGTVKRAVIMLKRAAAIRKFVKEHDICTAYSFTHAPNEALALSGAKCKKYISCRDYERLIKSAKLYSFALRRGCNILFNALEMQKKCEELFPGNENKLFTAYNIIDCDKAREDAKEELDGEFKKFYGTHRVIAFSSRFVGQKCQWDMLKSFELLKKNIPDAGLIFLGCRGEHENAVREMAQRSAYSDDIIFAGFQKNVFKFVSRAEVFAMTSYYEGFPNVIVEALAVGTPTVSTDCTSGPAEVLAPSRPFLPHCDRMTQVECGILCPVMSETPDFDYGNTNGAHREYAKALEAILTDEELRARLSENGKKRADELSAENMKQVYFDLTDN